MSPESGRISPEEGLEQRALPGAVGTDDTDDLTGFDRQVEAVEGGDAPEALGQARASSSGISAPHVSSEQSGAQAAHHGVQASGAQAS